MKTKITNTTLSLLTVLAVGSSIFVGSGNQNSKVAVASPNTFANTASLPVIGTSIALRGGGINKYEYAGQSTGVINTIPGKTDYVFLDVKNTGNTTWEKGTFHLGTSHAQDRNSAFYDSTWLSENRVAMAQDIVTPGNFAQFSFSVTAPEKSGIYYEYFRPVIDGKEWLKDVGIYWKIIVKNPNEDESTLPIYNKIRAKKIVITISQQNLKCYEDTDIVCDFLISSGLPQLPTPTGNFKVERKRDVAYSAAYDLYMNYWMAFTPNEAYGIHELPYWKYSWGIVTEGENHLGIKASHGCVRLGIGSAKQVYDWAPIGTPVQIVN